ncbi:MAG: outer membrane beta-barrel protein [Alphaproteobacteria bacterium]|nr:outer membrane beta-barrel protein [Alphaproteobacteria bacterium]
MTLRTVLLGAVTAVAFNGAASAANFNGWYLSMEGGANWVADWDHVVSATTPGNASFDTGWAVLASVGYAFEGNWRTEFEVGYRSNNIDALTSGGGPITTTGDLWEGSFMVNALYDIRLGDKLGLSLGVGAGGDFADLSVNGGFAGSADDWTFAYQGIAGLNYAIGRQTSAFINYRYFRAHEPEFSFAAQGGPNINGDDFQKHTVTFGLRYALASPQTMSDVPPPMSQPPAAEPSGPSRQFIVFFGFNKYHLTTAALRVIAEAVIAAKEDGSATVIITGHTDTVGGGEFNQRLSMRRSNAVKAEMVRQGVSAAGINTTGRGENELLVQTTDNVKEPQNRRATIDVN